MALSDKQMEIFTTITSMETDDFKIEYLPEKQDVYFSYKKKYQIKMDVKDSLEYFQFEDNSEKKNIFELLPLINQKVKEKKRNLKDAVKVFTDFIDEIEKQEMLYKEQHNFNEDYTKFISDFCKFNYELETKCWELKKDSSNELSERLIDEYKNCCLEYSDNSRINFEIQKNKIIYKTDSFRKGKNNILSNKTLTFELIFDKNFGFYVIYTTNIPILNGDMTKINQLKEINRNFIKKDELVCLPIVKQIQKIIGSGKFETNQFLISNKNYILFQKLLSYSKYYLNEEESDNKITNLDLDKYCEEVELDTLNCILSNFEHFKSELYSEQINKDFLEYYVNDVLKNYQNYNPKIVSTIFKILKLYDNPTYISFLPHYVYYNLIEFNKNNKENNDYKQTCENLIKKYEHKFQHKLSNQNTQFSQDKSSNRFSNLGNNSNYRNIKERQLRDLKNLEQSNECSIKSNSREYFLSDSTKKEENTQLIKSFEEIKHRYSVNNEHLYIGEYNKYINESGFHNSMTIHDMYTNHKKNENNLLSIKNGSIGILFDNEKIQLGSVIMTYSSISKYSPYSLMIFDIYFPPNFPNEFPKLKCKNIFDEKDTNHPFINNISKEVDYKFIKEFDCQSPEDFKKKYGLNYITEFLKVIHYNLTTHYVVDYILKNQNNTYFNLKKFDETHLSNLLFQKSLKHNVCNYIKNINKLNIFKSFILNYFAIVKSFLFNFYDNKMDNSKSKIKLSQRIKSEYKNFKDQNFSIELK